MMIYKIWSFPFPAFLKLSRAAGCDKLPDTVSRYRTVQQLLWISFVAWTHVTLVVSASVHPVGPISEIWRMKLPTARTECAVSSYCWFNPLRPLYGGRSLCAPSALCYIRSVRYGDLTGWAEADEQKESLMNALGLCSCGLNEEILGHCASRLLYMTLLLNAKWSWVCLPLQDLFCNCITSVRNIETGRIVSLGVLLLIWLPGSSISVQKDKLKHYS